MLQEGWLLAQIPQFTVYIALFRLLSTLSKLALDYQAADILIPLSALLVVKRDRVRLVGRSRLPHVDHISNYH